MLARETRETRALSALPVALKGSLRHDVRAENERLRNDFGFGPSEGNTNPKPKPYP
jgi:hypothetical protein